MKKFKIEIPSPCNENWNEMKAEFNGKFCGACNKTVIDFTKMSAYEIAATLKATKNVCGRISERQLKHTYFTPKADVVYFPYKAIAASILLLVSPMVAISQAEPAKQEYVNYEKLGEISMVGEPLFFVRAKVVDLKNTPLSNVSVDIVTETDSILATVISNNNGEVQLSLSHPTTKGLYLRVTDSGEYFSAKVALSQKTGLDGNYLLICEKKKVDRMIMGKMIQQH